MDEKSIRIRQNIGGQIFKIKHKLQEKLKEMMPLPDVLKMTQVKLKEANTMHELVDRNSKEIANEINSYKAKLEALDSRTELIGESRQSLLVKLEDLEAQLVDLEELNASLKNELENFQENCENYEELAEAKLNEITDLEKELELLLRKTEPFRPS